ncbi:hypothetical protein [Ekhidna sp. To15]|uniref:hypothetical protein n=1 Tax=Ekhidna sp. To15 TaxID=3395267 RepID=UPI003F51F6D7
MQGIKTEYHKTVLVIITGFLIMFWLWGYNWLLTSAIMIGALSILSTRFAKLIDYLWMKIAWVLGLIMPNVLLSLVFFIFLTPIALISRIFRKQNMLMLKGNQTSTFVSNKTEFTKGDFEKPW